MILRSLPFFFLVLPLVSAPASGTADALTLDDALVRVAMRHPELLVRRHHEEAANARLAQAGLRPDPQVEFTVENVLGTGARQGVRGVEATLLASQTIERGGKRERRTDLASRNRDVEIAAREVLLADLSAVAVSAYVAAILAGERTALAGDRLVLAREMLAATERLHAEGGASAAEVARARVAVATAELDARRAEAHALAKRTALAATWGGRAGEFASVSGRLQLTGAAPSESELRPGLAAHPRLALHATLIAREEAALALAGAAAAADLTAAAGVRYLRDGSDAGLVAAVSMPIPNRNRTRSEARAIQANLAAAEQGLRSAENTLQTELARACEDLEASRQTLALLRDQVLPAAGQARDAVERAQAEGFLPLADVLESRRTLLALRRDLLDAQSAFATALVAAESLADRTYPRTRALLSLP